MSKSVKELRESIGLSQIEISAKSGINYSTYVKKERGLRKWYYDEIVKLAEIFKCSIDNIKP